MGRTRSDTIVVAAAARATTATERFAFFLPGLLTMADAGLYVTMLLQRGIPYKNAKLMALDWILASHHRRPQESLL